MTVQIDDNNPSVTIGFERENDATHHATKYLHLKQTKYDFENIGLHYTVNDSCAGRDIKVDLTVSSNEFSFANSKTDENMVILRKRKDKRQSHQLVAYVEPVYCERNPMKGAIHSKPLCDFDLDTSVRFKSPPFLSEGSLSFFAYLVAFISTALSILPI